jgi:hypothetical protein
MKGSNNQKVCCIITRSIRRHKIYDNEYFLFGLDKAVGSRRQGWGLAK